jgi:hypothetical protein
MGLLKKRELIIKESVLSLVKSPGEVINDPVFWTCFFVCLTKPLDPR